MKKFLYLIVLTIIFKGAALGQPTDLFISEYVEGSSFNKAIEIYNGTNSAIDLAAGQYIVQVYFNGASTSSSVALTGTIQSQSVYIVAHPSATLGIAPNLTTTVINFNGNDAVVLRKTGSTGPILDVIGQVGFNPGTQWGSGDTSTLDRTIRRKAIICTGDVIGSDAFFTAPEWDGYVQNTFSGLGAHSTACTSTVNGLSVFPLALSFTTTANVPSLPQSYAITGNSLTAAVTVTAPLFFEISMLASGPFTNSLSIPSASFASGNVPVFVRYSPPTLSNNTGTVVHQSNSFFANLSLSGVTLSLSTICQVQGTASASGFTNQAVAFKGFVTADFQATNELGGFYLQQPSCDADPLSSDGIFISNGNIPVNVGEEVIVSGTIEEFFGRTQMKSVTSLSVSGSSNTVALVTLTLPVPAITEYEKTEGMLVEFTQTLVVTEVYTLARFGEVALSLNDRLYTPTEVVDPNDATASGLTTTGASNSVAVNNLQNLNDRSRILLDDKSSVQNPPVVPYVDATNNTLRCGSQLLSLTGVLDYAFSSYRVQPVINPAFMYAPRPALPSVGNADVRVASFNVLNYFNGDGLGGGFPTARGANTPVEFTRQRNKIIEAIKTINADVLGLMEMENDGDGPQSAVADLVNGLNTLIGAGTYTFVADPTALNGGTGTDAIKVALIYKPGMLDLSGVSKADNNSAHNRPPLTQTFKHKLSGEKFSVVVNHFKSKSCGGSTGADADQLDGQSCYNQARKLQAAALLNFCDSVKKWSGDDKIMVMGDINAYGQEDPIDMLLAGGLVHLLNNTYSYVFNGQSGSLDHAFVSPTLSAKVTGAAKWHINADEPIAKDYNQEFNPAYMYSADAFRSSDHDPLIIGLSFQVPNTTSIKVDHTTELVNVWPNPTAGALINVQSTGDAAILGLELFDETGMMLEINKAEKNNGQNVVLDVENLNTGIYLLKITTPKEIILKKIIIVR